MGGLPSLRNGIPLKECLEEAYLNSPTVDPDDRLIPNDEELPVILDKVYPCHEVVKIDYFLPGCPPSADLIWEALTALLEGQADRPRRTNSSNTTEGQASWHRKITIEPVTRVEGHGKVTIHLDDEGKVAQLAVPHRRVPRLRDGSSRAAPTGRRRSSSSGSAASAR